MLWRTMFNQKRDSGKQRRKGKKRKQKDAGSRELSPWILLDESFYGQKENRAGTLLLKGLLVYLIVGGTLGAYLSAFQISYSVWAVQLIVLFCAVFCALLYYHPVWENIGYLLLFLVVCFAAFNLRQYINSGFNAVLNDAAESASAYFDLNTMRSYDEQIANRYLAVTISMSFVGCVAGILFNIFISRHMQYFIVFLSAFGVLAIPLYLETNPSLLFRVMVLTGMLLAFIIRGGRHYKLSYTNSRYRFDKKGISYVYNRGVFGQIILLVFSAVLVSALLFMLILPQRQYEARYENSQWKESTLETMGNFYVYGVAGIFNFYPSTGGLLSGRLGGISSVRYDYNTDLRVTLAPYTYERIYLKTFTGAYYQSFENRWSRGKETVLEERECTDARQLRSLYNKGSDKLAKGVMDIENVAAAVGYYLPYYSLDIDKTMYQGETASYEYYPLNEEADSKRKDKGRWKKEKALWLDIPEENRAVIQDFVEEAGLHGDTEEIVQQLRAYYQENIPYTYSPGATPRGKDFINFFLTENRKGYCSHFASAATLIFRYMGIPARYVEGYAIDYSEIAEDGELLRDKQYEQYYQGYSVMGETGVVQHEVTDADAHAWVEVYEKGKGWQVVEITPYSDEEALTRRSFWSIFMNFLNGGGGSAEEENSDNRQNRPVVDETTKEISGYVVLILAVLFVLAVTGQRLWKTVQYRRKYIRSNNNDRIILQYTSMMQRYRKRYPEFINQISYPEQIAWLRKRGLWRLEEKQARRLQSLLERAGFSMSQLSGEEYLWLCHLMEELKKSRKQKI